MSPLVSVGVSVFFLLALVNGIGYLFRSVFFGYLFGNAFAIGLLLLILAFDKKNGFIGFSALAVYPLMMLVILNVLYRKYFFGKRHTEADRGE